MSQSSRAISLSEEMDARPWRPVIDVQIPPRERHRARKETEAMIAVIAENVLKDGQEQEFLDLSTRIRPSIENIDGFLSVLKVNYLQQAN